MKKVLFNSLLVLFVIGLTPIAHAQKSKYTSSEANVSVIFHSSYEESEETKEDYRTVKVQGIFDEMVYFFAYTVHDGDLDDKAKLEKISLESFIGGLGAEIETNEMWKLKKRYGIKATLSVPEKGLRGDYRVIIVDQIQYQITVVGAAEAWDEKRVKKFFKSLKIKK